MINKNRPTSVHVFLFWRSGLVCIRKNVLAHLYDSVYMQASSQSHISAFLDIVLEHLFNLKFAAKDLERNAKKSEKAEKEEKVKLKKVSSTWHAYTALL